MKNKIVALLGAMLVLITVSTNLAAQDKATPEEVVQKVREAAKTLAQSGQSALPQFNDKQGPWVWKDSYVFVFDCAKGTTAAHPIRPDLVGEDASNLKGAKGKKLMTAFCAAKNKPSGEWVEYWWPKPGEKNASRKVSYILQAVDTPYVVGAGIYDEKTSVADLEKLTASQK